MKVESSVEVEFVLTDEGKYVLEHGSHEYVVYSAIPEEGIAMADLMVGFKFHYYGFFRKFQNMQR